MPLARLAVAALLFGSALEPRPAADTLPVPAVALERAMSAAEASLRAGELESAESHYRAALVEGWLLLGSLETAGGRRAEALQAFHRASTVGAETQRARRSLALLLASSDKARWTPPELAGVPRADRPALQRRVVAALASAYLNLGVMQAQGQRFTQAAELLETAAEIDPAFPKVQYSLGVACFNAQQFDKATGPLARALADQPHDVALKRMLAIAWLNTEAFDKAAELLRDDPGREDDASLQYAYGLALVRGNRAPEAEPVFARLLARHGDSAELNVLLGQAHAQRGDYDAAIQSLKRALELKPDVAEASAALGLIYLRQGQLPEAEAALRAELKGHPSDVKTAHNLATVLDRQDRPQEALAVLREVLKAKPDFADARYLLGKVLLAQGAAEEAAQHLEAAARLAPEDANIHYQLGQAYQKLGRADAAREQFEVFQKLKDKRRGGAS
jgi:tetratricopeptide (TPR) repeat protein